MKTNKGFAPIVIVLIIVAVLAVGGVAYYSGKNSNTIEEKQEVEQSFSPENKDINLSLILKSNIESYMASGPYKTETTTKKSACSSIFYGYENNYAYARVYCGEYDKNFTLGSASNVPARFEYDSSYKIISHIEASECCADESKDREVFGSFYDVMVKKTPSNEETAKQATEALAKIKNTEESSSEVFKNQPGAIKFIDSQGAGKWTLAVDLLSHNSKWIPGVDSTGGFFINQNSKIRNLFITANTKAYTCKDARSDSLTNTSSFISNIQSTLIKAKTDPVLVGEFGYTAYFDINGTNITAIYMQCLP
jgi:hypothetical protein